MAKPFTLASPGVVEPPQAVQWYKVCPVCLKQFEGRRSDALTCGRYCHKQRALYNRIMRRELAAAGAETSDDFLAWLATKVIGRVTFLEDGTPHVHWQLTGRFIYWLNLHLVTLADGTTWDDVMDELAGPLVAAYRRGPDG